MAIISTDIGSSLAGGGFAGGQPDILISPESVSRLPSTAGSEFDSETRLVQDVGSRLHEYETTNQQLHADLLDAANEKQHLVDALRDLHRQFHSLQQHADRQREVLISEGEELHACQRRIALLQKELVAIRADHERSRKLADVNETSKNAGKYEYVVASYRDALREMRRKLARQQAACAAQEKAQVELLRKMQLLEQRAEEFEGLHVQLANTEAELRKCLADREKQIGRLNKYIIRLQRELNLLNEGLHSQNLDVSVSDSGRDKIDSEPVPSAKARLKRNKRPADPVRQMILAAKRKARSHGNDETSRISASQPTSGNKDKTPPVVELPQERPKAMVTERPDKRKLPEQFVIVPVGDQIEGIQFPLNKKIMTVGRSPENDIRVRDLSISRFHTRIILENSGVTVEDLGSTNGLRVNSEHKKRYEIKHGDRFRIGRVEFELVDLAIRASGLRTEPTT
jgi:hypothetical protein